MNRKSSYLTGPYSRMVPCCLFLMLASSMAYAQTKPAIAEYSLLWRLQCELYKRGDQYPWEKVTYTTIPESAAPVQRFWVMKINGITIPVLVAEYATIAPIYGGFAMGTQDANIFIALLRERMVEEVKASSDTTLRSTENLTAYWKNYASNQARGCAHTRNDLGCKQETIDTDFPLYLSLYIKGFALPNIMSGQHQQVFTVQEPLIGFSFYSYDEKRLQHHWHLRRYTSETEGWSVNYTSPYDLRAMNLARYFDAEESLNVDAAPHWFRVLERALNTQTKTDWQAFVDVLDEIEWHPDLQVGMTQVWQEFVDGLDAP